MRMRIGMKRKRLKKHLNSDDSDELSLIKYYSNYNN